MPLGAPTGRIALLVDFDFFQVPLELPLLESNGRPEGLTQRKGTLPVATHSIAYRYIPAVQACSWTPIGAASSPWCHSLKHPSRLSRVSRPSADSASSYRPAFTRAAT